MKKPEDWSAEMASAILAMHDAGKRLRDICARYDLHHGQIQQFLAWNNRKPQPKRFLTGKALKKVIRQYTVDGMSARQIALNLGMSDSTVRDALHSSGVRFRPRGLLSPGEQKDACRMYRQGLSYAKVAEEFGCCPEVIRDVLHRRNVTLRPKRKLDPRCLRKVIALYDARMTPAEIGARYGVNENTIKREIMLAGGTLRGVRDDVHRSIPLNIAAFESESEEAQYWVGFAITDGSVHENGTFSVALQLGDIKHLYKLRKFLGSSAKVRTGRLNRTAFRPRAYFAKLSVCSKNLVDSLISFGVVPRKTGKEELLRFAESRHTWRGAIDGDGSVGWHKRGYFWIKLYGSRKLCEQFRNFVLTLAPDCRAQVQRSGGIFTFGLCCSPAETVARELYRDCSTYLNRKHSIVKPLLTEAVITRGSAKPRFT